MNVSIYLSFAGQCEEAFAFYERCLGAKPGPLFRYAGSPMEGDVPEDWQQKVMHASVTIGDQVLQGADAVRDKFEPPKGFSLSVNTSNPDEADRMFESLAQGGRVIMPIEKTFWAERFGMVVDPYGIQWMINS